MRNSRHWIAAGMIAAVLAAYPGVGCAAQGDSLPRIETVAGRHALIVDGRPFLMLGAQANNSSNWPAALPKVWPVIRQLHANTLEIPVAWQQVEPVEGRFDFSWVDVLLREARENDVRLVLLWFGTWKNTNPNYTPEWVRTDNRRFPRMRMADGRYHYVLSPFARTTLEADKRAFVRLIEHLKAADPDNRVIMVQVENEIGSYDLSRDQGADAERLFGGAVPVELARMPGRKPGSWQAVFGEFADQAFMSWYMARYVDEIAAAGKAVKNLPMYCNSALGDAFNAKSASTSPTGGPQWNMIDVWKAAAPHIDLVAPDIYSRDPRSYAAYLGYYARPDNALMVPETGNSADFARFFWPALGKGTIGFSPFGMDLTGYFNYPLGARALDPATLDAFASKYALFAPIARQWAAIAFTHPTWGTAKGDDAGDQSTVMGRWKITAQYGLWQFGEPNWTFLKMEPAPGKTEPIGGMVVAQLGPDEFLVSGSDVRVRLALADPAAQNGMMLRVEEGTFGPEGNWVASRVWNGDSTDYGLNFTHDPVLLRVKMGTWH